MRRACTSTTEVYIPPVRKERVRMGHPAYLGGKGKYGGKGKGEYGDSGASLQNDESERVLAVGVKSRSGAFASVRMRRWIVLPHPSAAAAGTAG